MDKEFIENPVIAYEKLKEENERLKEEIKKTNNLYLKAVASRSQYSFYLDKEEKENRELHKALEEIREYLHTLSSIDNDFVNTETYLRIQNQINEVLK